MYTPIECDVVVMGNQIGFILTCWQHIILWERETKSASEKIGLVEIYILMQFCWISRPLIIEVQTRRQLMQIFGCNSLIKPRVF